MVFRIPTNATHSTTVPCLRTPPHTPVLPPPRLSSQRHTASRMRGNDPAWRERQPRGLRDRGDGPHGSTNQAVIAPRACAQGGGAPPPAFAGADERRFRRRGCDVCGRRRAVRRAGGGRWRSIWPPSSEQRRTSEYPIPLPAPLPPSAGGWREAGGGIRAALAVPGAFLRCSPSGAAAPRPLLRAARAARWNAAPAEGSEGERGGRSPPP